MYCSCKIFKKEFKKMANEKESIGKRLSFVLTGGPSPKNLYKQLSKLKVYIGTAHPHESQNPKIIDFAKHNYKNYVKLN